MEDKDYLAPIPKRFLAYLIDVAIVIIVFFPLSRIDLIKKYLAYDSVNYFSILSTVLIHYLAFCGLWFSYQAITYKFNKRSLGKSALGLYTVKQSSYEIIGWRDLFFRETIFRAFSNDIFYLGNLFCLFNDHKKTLHDYLADTLVVSENKIEKSVLAMKTEPINGDKRIVIFILIHLYFLPASYVKLLMNNGSASRVMSELVFGSNSTSKKMETQDETLKRLIKLLEEKKYEDIFSDTQLMNAVNYNTRYFNDNNTYEKHMPFFRQYFLQKEIVNMQNVPEIIRRDEDFLNKYYALITKKESELYKNVLNTEKIYDLKNHLINGEYHVALLGKLPQELLNDEVLMDSLIIKKPSALLYLPEQANFSTVALRISLQKDEKLVNNLPFYIKKNPKHKATIEEFLEKTKAVFLPKSKEYFLNQLSNSDRRIDPESFGRTIPLDYFNDRSFVKELLWRSPEMNISLPADYLFTKEESSNLIQYFKKRGFSGIHKNLFKNKDIASAYIMRDHPQYDSTVPEEINGNLNYIKRIISSHNVIEIEQLPPEIMRRKDVQLYLLETWEELSPAHNRSGGGIPLIAFIKDLKIDNKLAARIISKSPRSITFLDQTLQHSPDVKKAYAKSISKIKLYLQNFGMLQWENIPKEVQEDYTFFKRNPGIAINYFDKLKFLFAENADLLEKATKERPELILHYKRIQTPKNVKEILRRKVRLGEESLLITLDSLKDELHEDKEIIKLLIQINPSQIAFLLNSQLGQTFGPQEMNIILKKAIKCIKSGWLMQRYGTTNPKIVNESVLNDIDLLGEIQAGAPLTYQGLPENIREDKRLVKQYLQSVSMIRDYGGDPNMRQNPQMYLKYIPPNVKKDPEIRTFITSRFPNYVEL